MAQVTTKTRHGAHSSSLGRQVRPRRASSPSATCLARSTAVAGSSVRRQPFAQLYSPPALIRTSLSRPMHDLVMLRRGTTSPLLSLPPFGSWVMGGRRLVLGLLHLHLHPSKACPAPRAPTTSIAAHAGHQHSYSSCGRNVTFLSSAQMKKKSSRMMMNRIVHADEL